MKKEMCQDINLQEVQKTWRVGSEITTRLNEGCN
jgi:hypothetical protein